MKKHKKRSEKNKSHVISKESSNAGKKDYLGLFKKYPIIGVLLLILVLFQIQYHEVLYQDKAFSPPDGKANFANVVFHKSDLSVPQWHPYLFSGMPCYANLLNIPDIVYLPNIVLKPFVKIWRIFSFILPINLFTLHSLIFCVGVVLFLRRFKVGYLAASLSSFILIFTPAIVAMYVFAHGSKMWTAAYIPIIMWAIDRLFEKVSAQNLAIAMILLGFQIQRAHIQIVYYSLMLIGCYAAFLSIRLIVQKAAIKEIIAKMLAFTSVVLVGLMLAAILYLPVHEYTPNSIRGGGGTNAAGQVEQSSGVGFDYATNWSFHPTEMSTWVIPGFYGFGGGTYWGKMPFTDFPTYMGILTLLLVGCAFIRQRQPIHWFLLGTIGVSTMIAFGKFFFVYQLLYDLLPFFNKFRVPVMILILVQFACAILAGFGLDNILHIVQESSDKKIKKWARYTFYAAIAVFAFGILVTLFQSVLESTMIKIYPEKYGPETDARLNGQRLDMLFRNMWIVVLILSAGLFSIYFYLKNTINATMLASAMILLTVIDLFAVNFKIIKPTNKESVKAYNTAENELITFLKSDESEFRVYPITNFGDNRFAGHGIGSIGGYNPAKLRLYQDFLDDTGFDKNARLGQYQIPYFLAKYVGLNQDGQLVATNPNPTARQADNMLLNVLNVKYVISPTPLNDPDFKAIKTVNFDGQNVIVLENKNPAPRVYLVGDYKVIPDRQAAIEEMKSGIFDPTRYAILGSDPGIAQPDSLTGSAQIMAKPSLHEIQIEYEASDQALLVLSEVYYPAWKAYVDGQPVDVIKANNIIRAIPVPAGKHQVVFRYQSDVFQLGAMLTLSGYGIVLFLFGIAWFGHVRRKKHPTDQSENSTPGGDV